MTFKRVAWFGPYALKQLGGIPSYRDRVVDERIINWAALEGHKQWLAVVDHRTRILEYCGDLVDLYQMDQLLNPIIPEQPAPEPVKEPLSEPVKALLKDIEETIITAAKPLDLSEKAIKAIDVKIVVEADPIEAPTITEEAPKKRGRKKKGDGYNFNF